MSTISAVFLYLLPAVGLCWWSLSLVSQLLTNETMFAACRGDKVSVYIVTCIIGSISFGLSITPWVNLGFFALLVILGIRSIVRKRRAVSIIKSVVYKSTKDIM